MFTFYERKNFLSPGDLVTVSHDNTVPVILATGPKLKTINAIDIVEEEQFLFWTCATIKNKTTTTKEREEINFNNFFHSSALAATLAKKTVWVEEGNFGIILPPYSVCEIQKRLSISAELAHELQSQLCKQANGLLKRTTGAFVRVHFPAVPATGWTISETVEKISL